MKRKSFITFLFLTLFSFVFLFSSAPVSAEDNHYLDDEHYFISKEKLSGGWINVALATMKTPASAETKNEAEFLTVTDGEEIWTKFYYKTRVLKKEEIKKGVVVISLEAGDEDGAYRAPESKDEAIGGSWFMAKITDLSDMYKGYVTVSGGYKVRLDNMRVVIK
ncbi:MAG TPA: hypothetical protein PLT13_01850 [Spirochaetota bacterium]|nr:hypothetical protein [Spirochaetota bacterium]